MEIMDCEEKFTFEEFRDISASMEILEFLSVKDLRDIYDSVPVAEYSTDEAILNEGEYGNSLFVILSGKAAAHTNDSDGNRRYLAKFKKGVIFGESAYFTDGIRNASISATADSMLIEIGVDYLEVILKKNRDLYEFLYGRYEEKAETFDEMLNEISPHLMRDSLPDIDGEAKFHLEDGKVSGVEAQFGILKNLSMEGCKVEMDGDIFLEHQKGILAREVPINLKARGMDSPVLAIGKVAWFRQATGIEVFGYRYKFGLTFEKFLKGGEDVLKDFCKNRSLAAKDNY